MQNTSKSRFSTQILIPSQNYRPVHPTASLTYPHGRPRVSANSQLPEESSGLLLPQALSFPKLSQFSFTPIIYSSHAISISKTCPIALHSQHISAFFLSLNKPCSFLPQDVGITSSLQPECSSFYLCKAGSPSASRPQFKYHLLRQAFPHYPNTNCHLAICSHITV